MITAPRRGIPRGSAPVASKPKLPNYRPPARYRRRPSEVQAMKVPAHDDVAAHGPLIGWFFQADFRDYHMGEDYGYTLNVKGARTSHARPGDWVCMDSMGRFFAVSAMTFANFYEMA